MRQNIKYKFCLQYEYNQLPIKDEKTIYIITDTKQLYVGNELYTKSSSSQGQGYIDLSGYVTQTQLNNALSNIELDGFIPIIAATPSDANEDKIPLITDIGTLKPSAYTFESFANYLVSNFNVLTKDQVNILTKEEFQELSTISPTTVYIISDTQEIYIGNHFYSSGTTRQVDGTPQVENSIGIINNSQINSTLATPTVITLTSS